MIFEDQRLSYIFEGMVACYQILRPVSACLGGERAAEDSARADDASGLARVCKISRFTAYMYINLAEE